MPCIAVATASRARYAHIPAMNWAIPPKTAANGASTSGVVEWFPYHPATFAATMNVAAAKPNRPRIDGAAIGCKKILVAKPSAAPSTPAIATARRSSIVLMFHLLGLRENYIAVRYV